MTAALTSTTIHEALWFIDKLDRFHLENIQHPRDRFTRTCLQQNVHPNHEAFVISDANHAQEINFGGCFSRLRRKKCIESIDCYGSPADAWVWFIPFRRGNPEALRATVSAPLFLWARQLVAPIGGSKMLARRSAAAGASAALFLGAVSPRAF